MVPAGSITATSGGVPRTAPLTNAAALTHKATSATTSPKLAFIVLPRSQNRHWRRASRTSIGQLHLRCQKRFARSFRSPHFALKNASIFPLPALCYGCL